MSGIFFQPIHEMHLLSEEPDALITIQGNSLLATNEPYTHITPTSLAVVLGKNPNCPISQQCVAYVEGRGVVLPDGNANQIEPNIEYPVVGGAVVFWGGYYGHIAFIEEIDIFKNRILISEQNWEGCGVVSYRWILLSDETIKGFIL